VNGYNPRIKSVGHIPALAGSFGKKRPDGFSRA